MYENFLFVFLSEMATASERRCLMLEIEMMKELGVHRHLVSIVACCTTDSRVALVMEYVPGGNLYDFLKKQRVKVLIKHTYLSIIITRPIVA